MAQSGIGFTSQVGFLSSPETNDPCQSGMDELSFRMSCIGKPDAWNEGPLDESKVEIMNRWLGSLGSDREGRDWTVCDGPRLDGGRWKVGTPCTSSKRPGPFFFLFGFRSSLGRTKRSVTPLLLSFLWGNAGAGVLWLDIVHIWIRSVSDFHYSVCFGPRHFSGLFCFSLGIRV